MEGTNAYVIYLTVERKAAKPGRLETRVNGWIGYTAPPQHGNTPTFHPCPDLACSPGSWWGTAGPQGDCQYWQRTRRGRESQPPWHSSPPCGKAWAPPLSSGRAPVESFQRLEVFFSSCAISHFILGYSQPREPTVGCADYQNTFCLIIPIIAGTVSHSAAFDGANGYFDFVFLPSKLFPVISMTKVFT